MRSLLLFPLLVSTLSCAALGQAASARTELATKPGQDTVTVQSHQSPLSAANEINVDLHARLLHADPKAQNGNLTLAVVAKLDQASSRDGMAQQPLLIIEIPLSSTADAYGESRSCSTSKEGRLTFTYSAGLDEKNFTRFNSGDEREFQFLLNKYLCRALAAPFRCSKPGGTSFEQKLPNDMGLWKVGESSYIKLSSTVSPAKASVSRIELSTSGHTFDYANCEKIAPSNGMCCVGHKSTQWHCGGTPVGEGWHQVSGDCFHRETGASCNY